MRLKQLKSSSCVIRFRVFIYSFLRHKFQSDSKKLALIVSYNSAHSACRILCIISTYSDCERIDYEGRHFRFIINERFSSFRVSGVHTVIGRKGRCTDMSDYLCSRNETSQRAENRMPIIIGSVASALKSKKGPVRKATNFLTDISRRP